MFPQGCCTPPPKKNDCSCKEGILCALDWFYQDFLTNSPCIKTGTLKYYPELPKINGVTSIPNTIYKIPYMTQDIVPVYISASITEPYSGDISYLNVCTLQGFSFELAPDVPSGSQCTSQKEADIIARFNRFKCAPLSSTCCKNGVMEYLRRVDDFLKIPGNANSTMIISTPYDSFRVTTILAINNDTVWAKDTKSPILNGSKTVYYVISICEIIGITFDKSPMTSL